MSKKNKNKEKEEICSCGEKNCDCGEGNCNCHENLHSCCCDEEGGFERQFYTKAEKIQMLEEYLADLKAEQAGVEEALEELRKAS